MTKAEEAALKAYPRSEKYTLSQRLIINDQRDGFIQGYETAEKDLALTIQDLELLHTFLYAVKNNKHGAFTFTRLTDEQYAEVLKRYLETKK